jgi:hypothetical protein
MKGSSYGWESFSSINDTINTSSCNVGQLAYVSSSGTVLPAIATSIHTLADCVVTSVGNEYGKVKLAGFVNDVLVESGVSFQTGETCYLSAIEEGKITDNAPLSQQQAIGIAISDSDTTSGTVDIWFNTSHLSGNSFTLSDYDYYQDLLSSSKFERLTVDTFINRDLIDDENTTIDVDYQADQKVEGESGDIFQSLNLRDDDSEYGFDGINILNCQLSSRGENLSNQE